MRHPVRIAAALALLSLLPLPTASALAGLRPALTDRAAQAGRPAGGCCWQPIQSTGGLSQKQRGLLDQLLTYKATMQPAEVQLFESLLERNQLLNSDQEAILQEFLADKQRQVELAERARERALGVQPEPPAAARPAPPAEPPPVAAAPLGPGEPKLLYHELAPPKPL